MGTLSNIPVIPHKVPQTAKDKIATSGLIFNVFPINRGSTRLPINNTIVPTPNSTMRNGINSPNCINANMDGSSDPRMGPIDGMKLKMNIKKAQNNGESIPTSARTI